MSSTPRAAESPRPATPQRPVTPPRPPKPDSWAIDCENLVKIFKTAKVEVVALQGLDLRVPRGEMVAVVGASGSGKSTLLKILSGLEVPSAGKAQVAGRDLLAMGSKARVSYRRDVVGFVFQQNHQNLLPYLSAADNVALPLSGAGVGPREQRSRVRELLDLVGVGHVAGRKPAMLSGGEQQRVAIAAALANRPEVVLADEPTGELDSASAEQVYACLQDVNAQLGATVVIVTHDPGIAERVDRTVAIKDGRTSVEFRRVAGGEAGAGERKKFIVIDRAGRLQIPSEYVDALGLRELVEVDLMSDHLRVSATNTGERA